MRNAYRIALLAAIVVDSAAAPIDPSTLPNGAAGSAYAQTLTFNCNCSGVMWGVFGSLPPGLSFNPNPNGNTASISGVPTAGGSYSFTVQAAFSDLSGTQSYTINVLQIAPSALPNATQNTAYSATFSVQFGSGNYNWSATGTPPGLTLSAAGVLSGSPTKSGVFNVSVTASPQPGGPGGPSVSAAYQLTVKTNLAISSSVSLPNGVQGFKYSTTMTASGGAPGYTFAVTPSTVAPNNLPPGLILNVNGLLSGVPTAAGNYGFNITVTDSQNNQATSFFQLIIAAPFSITTASPLPTGTLQVAYSQSINAAGGNPPYSFSITAGQLPPGLTFPSSGGFTGTAAVTGTFSFTVQATDSFGYISSKQFQLTIAPAGPLLQVTPAQLMFTATAGGASPPSQTVAIVAPSNGPVNYAAQILAANGALPGWLSISQTSGAAPAALTIAVTPGTLAPGNYQATIQITIPNNSSQAPINITAGLTITGSSAAPSAMPSALRFLARASMPSTQEQSISVSNMATPNVAVAGGSPWLTATGRPPVIRVDVNSQGLAAGSYHDIVRLSSANGSIDVPVSLFVQSPGPSMALSVNGLRFESRQGSGSTRAQTVSVLNLGDSTISWNVSLLSGSDWLTINPGSGTSTSSTPGRFTLAPSAGTANLPAGPRYALVSVTDPNAMNSPQYVTAVFDNEPAASPALPDLSTGGLFFTPSVGAQTIFVYTSSSAPVGFGVSVSGGSWLNATPSNGTASTSSPGDVSVSINASGLAPGIYYGSVNVEMNGVMRISGVTLAVPPSTGGAIVHADAACSASQLAITQTGLAGNFSVPAGWPATLIVQLNDNCGNPVANGSVIASFSSGDPPLSLRGDGVSNAYTATWQPLATSPETTVTVQALAGTLQATQQFTGAVNQNATPPPSLVPNGTLDIFFNAAAANATGTALAPGSVIQVYGSGFAPSLVAPPNVPLLNQISGTLMLIGSKQIPLFFVSSSVLAAQVPFELTPNQQYQAIVSANGALTLPETLDIVPMQAGVLFSVNDGTVVAQRLDGSLVSASSPAHPGETLVLYLTGMGATNPAVPSGSATPVQFVPVSTQPLVTLDGQTVDVGYAGLTPTGIGLYQINIAVPSNARAGSLALVITQNGVAANSTTLPVSN